jgi:GrpB-like predicted nucleotidyltransferase (UPF0157 family)
MKPESKHRRKGQQQGLRLRLKLTLRNHPMIKSQLSKMKMKMKRVE